MIAEAALVLILFAEPGFPAMDVWGPLPEVAGETASSVEELEELLAAGPDRVLVWRHGSAFPAEAWPAIQRFLRSGGSLLHLGGVPFTHPVTGPPGARRPGPYTVSYLKQLRLNQAYEVPAGPGARLHYLAASDRLEESRVPPLLHLPEKSRAFALEPRLTSGSLAPAEEGAPGPREGLVRPLAFVRSSEDGGFPGASGAFALDWMMGAYAGGRWVIRPLDAPLDPYETERLTREAALPPHDFRADPDYAVYRAGEEPALTLRLHRPSGGRVASYHPVVGITTPGGRTYHQPTETLSCAETGSLRVLLEAPGPEGWAPGRYEVEVQARGLERFRTGFWVFDPELFTSGNPLTFDGYTLLKGGVPEPVIGTTVMSRSVHRDFLFEPNVAEWHRTFSELASLHVNLVRTGVWYGWDRLQDASGAVDEAWLRALEAYYLTAHSHGIPIIFTFYAFMPPEADPEESPYFDPRALDRQRRLVGETARRFAPARQMVWDLINEPSFASQDRVWSARPHGGPVEEAAFLDWLEARYGGGGRPWQEVVRERWRLRTDEAIGLPLPRDFGDATVFGERRPERARAWLRFSQDAFGTWIDELSGAIREKDPDALITVGQDEGGLTERPSPLFHHDRVDFTSIHTWWYNHRQLWDITLAKGRGTPLLVSETGIMQREDLAGVTLRTPGVSADLLSRKIGYAFAGGAFGVVEWVYDMNPYMDSDNEAAIGLRRPDGSYKPEHRVLREFASFAHRNRELFAGYQEPEAVLLVPFHDMWGPRAPGITASQNALQTWSALSSRGLRAVPDGRTASDLGSPDLILLPSATGISDAGWEDVMRAVREGATLLATGWFEEDEAGLPAERLDARARVLLLHEAIEPPGGLPSRILPFPLDIVQSWPRAAGAGPWRTEEIGRGRVLHVPLPLEWSADPAAAEPWYGAVIETEAIPPGITLRVLHFQEADLVVAVSERDVDVTIRIAGDAELEVPAGRASMMFLGREGRLLDDSHRRP